MSMPQSDEARLQPGHSGTMRVQALGGRRGAPGGMHRQGTACKEAAFFFLQVFYSPTRTKVAVAVVDSQDKIIVVGFFFSPASLCHLEIFFFLENLFFSPPPPM